MRHLILVLLALSFGTATLVSARISEQVPVGPRAIAMGGAYSAIADDASAIFWNPAGLSRISHQEISGTHANLFNSDITDNFASFVLPLAPTHVVAADWYRSGFDDSELRFIENRFDLSYAARLHPRLSVGVTGKYLTRDIGLDDTSVRRGSGVGLDLGVLASPYRNLTLGIAAQDVFDTNVTYSGESDETVPAFPRNVRLAAAYRFGRYATVAFDSDDRYHLGAEVRPVEGLAVRGGVQRSWTEEESRTYSFGAGIETGVLRFDYAYDIHPVLDPTNHFGVSLVFNFNPSRVRIEKAEMNAVYPSLYKSYDGSRSPLGSLQVNNLSDETLEARISIFAPSLMDAPQEEAVALSPGVTTDVPLHGVLSKKVFDRQDVHQAKYELTVSYQSQRLPRRDKTTSSGWVHSPGTIDWGSGLAQLAAFVTPQDQVIEDLKSAAISSRLNQPEEFGIRNLDLAQRLIDYTGALGVTYVPDPLNPFSAVSEKSRAVDSVRYPRETLRQRAGDCDDSAALVASLLANVGVPSKLVDVPGHVFLLLDTGLHVRHQLALGVPEDVYVVIDDGVWIPLETTAISRGFAEAWILGAQKYRDAAAQKSAALIDLAAAMADYPAALPPGEAALLEPPDDATLSGLFEADRVRYVHWQTSLLDGQGLPSEARITPMAANKLAQVYYRADRLEDALRYLRQALDLDQHLAFIHNNIGVVLATQGDTENASRHLSRANELEPSDPGILLNQFLLELSVDRRDQAADALEQAMGVCKSATYACDLLGIRIETSAGRSSDPTDVDAIRQLLERAWTISESSIGGDPDDSSVGDRLRNLLRTFPGSGGQTTLGVQAPRSTWYWKPGN